MNKKKLLDNSRITMPGSTGNGESSTLPFPNFSDTGKYVISDILSNTRSVSHIKHFFDIFKIVIENDILI